MSRISVTIILLLFLFAFGEDVPTVIVLGNESMPFNGIVDGKNVGMSIDVLEEITKHGGPRFEYRLGLPWKRAQVMVQMVSDTPTAIIPLTRTPTREVQYLWITQLYSHQQRIFSLNRDTSLTIDDIKDIETGVILGQSAIPLLKNLGFTAIYEVKNIELLVKMLGKNRLNQLVDSEAVVLYQWIQQGFAPEDLCSGPPIGEKSHIYIAGGLTFPLEIAEMIRDAMKRMKEDGSYDEVLRKWSR